MHIVTVLKRPTLLSSKMLFIVLGVVALAWITLSSPLVSAAAVFNSARDCNANAVVMCGAMSASELQQKVSADSSISAIYSCFGITSSDIENLGTITVAGQVSKDGTVTVNGQTVATNAITAGRQNIAGSTMTTCQGVTFFKRPPSVSFVSSPLDAFVIMNNGRFQSAILASCGNPVIASPKPIPTPPTAAPTPAPTPPPVTPTPSATMTPQPTPVVQAVQTPAPAPAPKQLPRTGAGDVVGIFITTSVIATLGHSIVTRKRLLVAADQQ